MSINDRISTLITQLELNPNSFSDQIGVRSPVVYNIVKGRRSKPSFELLQKILVTFSTINANWLLRGEGDVFRGLEEEVLPEPAYQTLESRVEQLLTDLRDELGMNPSLEELNELVGLLLHENVRQKDKISALYAKQESIIEVLRDRLGLDL